MSFFDRMKKSPRARAALSQKLRARLQVEALESRIVPYTLSGNAWPHANLVTISFVPDGTNLGGVTSNLFATFNAKFGSAATWQNQILKAAQVWAQQTNLNFAVVSDNGAATGSGNYQQGGPGMGDIRIGGYNFGSSVLAQAYMPPPVNNYSIAGDITFNTGQTFNIGQTYDVFTVAVHEVGHALGLYHTGVFSADMYASYTSVKSGLNSDDIAGIQAIYNGVRKSDQYDAGSSPNNSFSSAANITSSINTTSLTALVTNLDITQTSETDYYVFTAPAGTSGTLAATVQSKGLSLLRPLLKVYNASQTQIASATGSGFTGSTITATASVTAGQQYYVMVDGADSSALGSGAYALTLNFGTGSSPTVPLPNTQTPNGTPLTAGGGQANAQSQEFLANTYTNDIQLASLQAVAMDANGNYVITWSSHGQDGSGWGVYAQRYNASGVPQGSEFRVNTYTAGDQLDSTAAMDAAGDFVITWSSNGQDGSGWGVYAQRYDALGVPVGSEFRVNTYTAGDQRYSTVAMDSVGDFVVTWSSNNQIGSGWDVYAQRYSALGLPVGGEFRVNTTTADDQMYSTVAMDSVGDFVVTWSSHKQDGGGWGVYGQRYSALGLPLGGEFQINTYTKDDQMYSSVAMNATGSFVITWSSHNQDGSGWGIYGQRYDALGMAEGGEFQVNTTTASDQEWSTVAIDSTGDFLVTWSSNSQDGSGWGVYGQQYTPLGAPTGSEFQINTTTAGNQQYSSVAMDSLGHVVVVWSGSGAGDSAGVYGQRYSTLSAGMDSYWPFGEDPEDAHAVVQSDSTVPQAAGPMGPLSASQDPAAAQARESLAASPALPVFAVQQIVSLLNGASGQTPAIVPGSPYLPPAELTVKTAATANTTTVLRSATPVPAPDRLASIQMESGCGGEHTASGIQELPEQAPAMPDANLELPALLLVRDGGTHVDRARMSSPSGLRDRCFAEASWIAVPSEPDASALVQAGDDQDGAVDPAAAAALSLVIASYGYARANDEDRKRA